MTLSSAEKLDSINIGLMLLSVVVAMVMPFEVFLFSYAVLGPLHYLTEISWLHDKQYYTKGRWDSVWLMVIGLLITVAFFNRIYKLELGITDNFTVGLTYIAFLSALIMVVIKRPFYRIAGILLVACTYALSQHLWIFLAVFLPTLVHVFVFTGLFMLYGALKSKSRTGLIAVGMLIVCAIALFMIAPDWHPFHVTQYGKTAYLGDLGPDEEGQARPIGFFGLHMTSLTRYFGVLAPEQGTDGMKYWMQQVFDSRSGILLGRFIAFAYTYHYLNWFSKTRIIQWHKVPKARFAIVLVVWVASLALYFYNYAVGLQWLFFLSFLHVLLEFPLNFTTIIGIGQFFRKRISSGSSKSTPQAA